MSSPSPEDDAKQAKEEDDEVILLPNPLPPLSNTLNGHYRDHNDRGRVATTTTPSRANLEPAADKRVTRAQAKVNGIRIQGPGRKRKALFDTDSSGDEEEWPTPPETSVKPNGDGQDFPNLDDTPWEAVDAAGDKTLNFKITDRTQAVRSELRGALDGTLQVRTRPDPSVLPVAVVREIDEGYHTFFAQPKSYIRYSRLALDDLGHDDDRVDYELDSDDEKWLDDYNSHRARKLDPKQRISEEDLEFALDSLEKQAHVMKSVLLLPDDIENEEQNCVVCRDGSSDDTNQIIFCDGCNIGVHQACYGVRLIPEGEWNCMLCELVGPVGTPKRDSLRCHLCGKRNGAMKLTTRGEWVHVQCAWWLPELAFEEEDCGGAVTHMDDIPAWRWQLLCSLCGRQRGAPAVCMSPRCNTPFHVTCAQKKNLGIILRANDKDSSVMERQSWCSKHIPRDFREYQKEMKEYEKQTKKRKRRKDLDMKRTLKLLVKEAQSSQNKNIQARIKVALRKQRDLNATAATEAGELPDPLDDNLDFDLETVDEELLRCCGGLTLAEAVRTILPQVMPVEGADASYVPNGDAANTTNAIHRQNSITEYTMTKIYQHWSEKRRRRRGLALLRRFQPSVTKVVTKIEDLSYNELVKTQKVLFLLRQNLERVRLILELARKRERAKRQLVHVIMEIYELENMPLMADLRVVLNFFKEQDPNQCFSTPVSPEAVPDYLDVIKTPMDLSTIEGKLNYCKYETEEEFWNDMLLIADNAMMYNRPETVFHQEATKLKELMEQVRSRTFQRENNPLVYEAPPPVVPDIAEIIKAVLPVPRKRGRRSNQEIAKAQALASATAEAKLTAAAQSPISNSPTHSPSVAVVSHQPVGVDLMETEESSTPVIHLANAVGVDVQPPPSLAPPPSTSTDPIEVDPVDPDADGGSTFADAMIEVSAGSSSGDIDSIFDEHSDSDNLQSKSRKRKRDDR